jgi:putative ABC transport system permease protein
MHLDKAISSGNGISATSNPVYSYILSGIALFILLIACINFINLTIARSLKRAKEIGIRKVVGSNKKQLIIQFMGESIILCMISFCLALVLTELLLPLFNTLANKSLSISYLLDAGLITALAGLFALTSFIAGFYPALVLTRFEPTKILYNRFDIQGKNYLQKSLVIAQFTIASFFVILTFVVYQQFKFLTSADLGYDDNNLVLIEQYNAQPKGAIFQKMLSKNPAIKEVAAKNGGSHSTLAKTSSGAVINFLSDMITANFLDELKIPVIAGRNFSTVNPTDSIDKILVNEAFVKEAGWTAPLGQKITITPEDNKVVEVIGVVKNYHYGSMNEPINPQVFRWQDINKLNAFYIKIQPGMSGAALDYIKTTYQELFPLSPYSYNFVQESNKMKYSDIAKWRQILLFGGLVTIIISFMGLFGLSVLSSERRKKEIGIRKVYGASVGGIVRLLTTDYLKLVLLSLIIAAPLTFIVAYKFLQTMLYRIPITPQLFIIPDILVILLAFVTVYLQTRQSAIVNPIKSLKNE